MAEMAGSSMSDMLSEPHVPLMAHAEMLALPNGTFTSGFDVYATAQERVQARIDEQIKELRQQRLEKRTSTSTVSTTGVSPSADDINSTTHNKEEQEEETLNDAGGPTTEEVLQRIHSYRRRFSWLRRPTFDHLRWRWGEPLEDELGGLVYRKSQTAPIISESTEVSTKTQELQDVCRAPALDSLQEALRVTQQRVDELVEGQERHEANMRYVRGSLAEMEKEMLTLRDFRGMVKQMEEMEQKLSGDIKQLTNTFGRLQKALVHSLAEKKEEVIHAAWDAIAAHKLPSPPPVQHSPSDQHMAPDHGNHETPDTERRRSLKLMAMRSNDTLFFDESGPLCGRKRRLQSSQDEADGTAAAVVATFDKGKGALAGERGKGGGAGLVHKGENTLQRVG
ncbi:unnamed protein product [Vitrella brassicaformis CCMP3155]|uniref:Uncharacterized protein n=1 Tax=Vitrella brassicaformis (strain CCMP3155) TaxID=1169540 RepID=A0A0G4GHJ3_VITBC|nr:unnamed protein product [Vitrella brassicaformis CCMP3155]|eukprot:CEM29204.1 unnamed protein product [Vitrella brassicaformis CCMP3155]